MTLHVLPPGGGDGEPDDGLVDTNADRSAIAAAMADKAMELASLLTVAQRRFAERWALIGDAREALLHAWPALREAKQERTINRHLGLACGNRNIRAYVDAIRGEGCTSSGITYRAVIEQLWHVGTHEDYPGYVQGAALSTLASEMRQSGLAALEGISPPDKKALGKGSGTPEATEPARANHLLQLLSTPIPIPKAKPG